MCQCATFLWQGNLTQPMPYLRLPRLGFLPPLRGLDFVHLSTTGIRTNTAIMITMVKRR